MALLPWEQGHQAQSLLAGWTGWGQHPRAEEEGRQSEPGLGSAGSTQAPPPPDTCGGITGASCLSAAAMVVSQSMCQHCHPAALRQPQGHTCWQTGFKLKSCKGHTMVSLSAEGDRRRHPAPVSLSGDQPSFQASPHMVPTCQQLGHGPWGSPAPPGASRHSPCPGGHRQHPAHAPRGRKSELGDSRIPWMDEGLMHHRAAGQWSGKEMQGSLRGGKRTETC